MKSLPRSSAKYWNMVALAERKGGELYPPLSNTMFRPDGSPFVGLEYLQIWENCTFAELGCGNGRILQSAARNSYRAIGIDFSIKQLENAKKHIANQVNIALIQHDLNQGLPIIGESIDIIYSVYGALDFVEEPYQLLMACWEMIRSNGHIVVLTSKLSLANVPKLLKDCQIEDHIYGGEEHEIARFRKRTEA